MYVDPDVDAVYWVLDLTGVFINGVIGGTIARQKRFDLIGFGFLALISALGGGLLRDVFMQKGTPTAFAEPMYLGFALLGGPIAWSAHLDGKVWRVFFGGGDAIVLGVWSVTGSIKALSLGLPWPSAILCGMLTAVGGGMIRDIAVGNVPTIFGGNTMYATPALLGASIMTAFHQLGLPGTMGMLVAAITSSGIAILAAWRKWTLPQSSETAPITMTRRQLRKMLARRERIGGEREWRRWKRAQGLCRGYLGRSGTDWRRCRSFCLCAATPGHHRPA